MASGFLFAIPDENYFTHYLSDYTISGKTELDLFSSGASPGGLTESPVWCSLPISELAFLIE